VPTGHEGCLSFVKVAWLNGIQVYWKGGQKFRSSTGTWFTDIRRTPAKNEDQGDSGGSGQADMTRHGGTTDTKKFVGFRLWRARDGPARLPISNTPFTSDIPHRMKTRYDIDTIKMVEVK
jgi:hypothetical protein